MTASMAFCAKHVCLLLTVRLLAKSILFISFEVFNDIFTIFASNLLKIVCILLASKSNMIGLDFAFRAENLATFHFRTSHPEFSLMFGSFFRNLLSLLVFLIVVDISWVNLPNIPTSTKYDSWNICELSFVLNPIEFRSHYFS